MAFFTVDTWRSLNTDDAQARESAFARCDDAWRRYRDYMESIRPTISARKWKAFMRCHRVHDCVIGSVLISSRPLGRKRIVDVSFMLEDRRTVVFKNVTDLAFTIRNQDAFPSGSHGWDYCEFERLAADRWRIAIWGDVSNEIVLTFEGIQWQRTAA